MVKPDLNLLSRIRGRMEVNLPMSDLTSFGIGGPADVVLWPESATELLKAGPCLFSYPITVLGGGSNVLVSDKGIRGITIVTTAWDRIQQTVNSITCDAGVPTHSLATFCAKRGLSGMEFGAGLPGSIGGAVVMNARAYGQEVSDVIEEVSFIDSNGHQQVRNREQLTFRYKQSSFQEFDCILTSMRFVLTPSNRTSIQLRLQQNIQDRESKYQTDRPSAGCIFKNDYSRNIIAGKVIDQCGLRGKQCGDAAVSAFHANYILNTGTASARDVMRLIKQIQQIVQEKKGIHLEPEIRMVGDFS